MEKGSGHSVKPEATNNANENWLLDNVANPFLNALALEPLKAIEDASNAASKQLTGKEWLPQVELQKVNKEVKPWSAEFFAQNIASGLAMVVPYGVAGRLTAGSLRLISKSNVLKAGAQAVVKSQKIREVGANLIRSNKTGQIMGAGIYDFAKEPEKEVAKGGAGTNSGEHAPTVKERLANGGAGAASFAVYEAMNPLLHKSGIVGKCIEQSGLAKKLAVKVAGLFTIGAAGSAVGSAVRTGINEGRMIRPEEMQDGVLSGGVMNIALPAVQHGIGRGVNFVNKKRGRGLSIQDCVGIGDKDLPNIVIDSPRKEELVNKSAFYRIQPTTDVVHSVDTKAELIKLGKGATEEDFWHELAHSEQRTDKTRDAVFVQLRQRLEKLNTGTIESSAAQKEFDAIKCDFIDQRIKDEVKARLTVQEISGQLNNGKTKKLEEKEIYQQVSDDPQYRKLFEKQCAEFVESKGKQLPREDYALGAKGGVGKVELSTGDGEVLFSGEYATVKEAVETAVKEKVSLKGVSLPKKVDLEGANLSGANFEGATLYGVNFSRANVEGANFEGARANEARFFAVRAKGANFKEMKADWACFNDAEIEGANFESASVKNALFYRVKGRRANFKEIKADGACFIAAEIEGADFERVGANKASFERANAKGANFRGIEADWACFEHANLDYANFEGACVYGADFTGVRAERANFTGIYAQGAKFFNAYLEGAQLDDAYMHGSSFESAKLKGVRILGLVYGLNETDIEYEQIDWEVNVPDMEIDWAPSEPTPERYYEP